MDYWDLVRKLVGSLYAILGCGLSIAVVLVVVYRWTRRSVERRREARGCCRKCGFDVRASKYHCPECGTLLQK